MSFLRGIRRFLHKSTRSFDLLHALFPACPTFGHKRMQRKVCSFYSRDWCDSGLTVLLGARKELSCCCCYCCCRGALLQAVTASPGLDRKHRLQKQVGDETINSTSCSNANTNSKSQRLRVIKWPHGASAVVVLHCKCSMTTSRTGIRLTAPDLDGLTYRPIMSGDIDAVEALHKNLFPIRCARARAA